MAQKKTTKVPKIPNKMTPEKVDKIIKFLSVAKTENELLKKYGESFKRLLKDKYEGYNLFEQKNLYDEKIYILLPEIEKNLKIQKKDWKYSIGVSDEGIDQPYIVVQLPKFKGKINIAPLFDVHYGHHAHRHDKFLEYVKWIKENDHVYAVIGGDLMENALDDGRGMTYDQVHNPESQLNDMIKMLAPIAHKILFAIPGNHELRTYHKTGIEVMRVIADKLKIPYFSGPVYATILANGYKWSMYTMHGYGNSQTKGGKMNMAGKARKFTGLVNFFLSGHTHDALAESETSMVEDPLNCRLHYMAQWTVVAPSFLGYEHTYAYKAGYPPPSKGGVSLELSDNGDYKAYLV